MTDELREEVVENMLHLSLNSLSYLIVFKYRFVWEITKTQTYSYNYMALHTNKIT